jgi:hypothetical protein
VPPSDPDIVRFIRGDLGCACPDEVLREIRIERSGQTSDLDAEFVRIDVGGRLLVWVLAVKDPPNGLADLVSCAVMAGLKERDRLSFNRLRVVLASANPSAIDESARQAFDACHRPDDRIHLHVVDSRSVPASILPPAEEDPQS